MTKRLSAWLVAAAIAATAPGFVPTAAAGDTTIVGPMTRVELAPDGKSAEATLKDGKSGEDVTVTITDDLTLDKLKDKRIVEGDEIRTRFEKRDGRNSSKMFKKTAGC